MKLFSKGAICIIVVFNMVSLFMALFYISVIRTMITIYYVVDWLFIGWVVVSLLFLSGWIVEWRLKAIQPPVNKKDIQADARRESSDVEYGYDLIGPDTLELCTSSSAFTEMRAHGYDWFRLVDIASMDGAGNGVGSSALITASNLGAALKDLKRFAPADNLIATETGVEWSPEKEKENPFLFWAVPLAAFLRGCLEWCTESGQDRVKIEFTRHSVQATFN